MFTMINEAAQDFILNTEGLLQRFEQISNRIRFILYENHSAIVYEMNANTRTYEYLLDTQTVPCKPCLQLGQLQSVSCSITDGKE